MWGMMISAFRTLPATMAFFLCIAAPALAEGDAVHGEKFSAAVPPATVSMRRAPAWDRI